MFIWFGVPYHKSGHGYLRKLFVDNAPLPENDHKIIESSFSGGKERTSLEDN